MRVSNKYEIAQLNVGDNFFETYGIELNNGRTFKTEIKSDIDESVIVNELFVKMMNWDEAIGKRILSNEKPYYVIGVIKDFHQSNFMREIEPLVIFKSNEDEFRYLSVRAESGTAIKTEKEIEKVWKELYPDSPYEAYFQEADSLNNNLTGVQL